MNAKTKLQSTLHRVRYLAALIVLTGCSLSSLESGDFPTGRSDLSAQPHLLSVLAGSAERLLIQGGEHYIHHDHLGSHTLRTGDHALHKGRQDFNSFGALRRSSGFVDKRGFTGQEGDASSALLQFQNRLFDPLSGRWTSPDPLFSVVQKRKMPLGQASTGYTYVANNPQNSVDPTGLVGDSVAPAAPKSDKAAKRAQIRAMLAGQKQARNSKPDGPAEKMGGAWKTKGLGEGYGGEEHRGVKYFKGAENDSFRLTLREGKLYNNKGDLFDTSGGSPTFAEQEKAGALFVMSSEGVFYATNDHQVGRVHHSSLMAGGSVAAAGEMIVKNGVPEAINRRSGHYRPDVAHLNQAVTELKAGGVEFKSVTWASPWER